MVGDAIGHGAIIAKSGGKQRALVVTSRLEFRLEVAKLVALLISVGKSNPTELVGLKSISEPVEPLEPSGERTTSSNELSSMCSVLVTSSMSSDGNH